MTDIKTPVEKSPKKDKKPIEFFDTEMDPEKTGPAYAEGYDLGQMVSRIVTKANQKRKL